MAQIRPMEERGAFWQSLGWENDMKIYSIYSNVPGDPALQHVWDEYQTMLKAGNALSSSG